jgi:hypothetical protein
MVYIVAASFGLGLFRPEPAWLWLLGAMVLQIVFWLRHEFASGRIPARLPMALERGVFRFFVVPYLFSTVVMVGIYSGLYWTGRYLAALALGGQA